MTRERERHGVAGLPVVFLLIVVVGCLCTFSFKACASGRRG